MTRSINEPNRRVEYSDKRWKMRGFKVNPATTERFRKEKEARDAWKSGEVSVRNEPAGERPEDAKRSAEGEFPAPMEEGKKKSPPLGQKPPTPQQAPLLNPPAGTPAGTPPANAPKNPKKPPKNPAPQQQNPPQQPAPSSPLPNAPTPSSDPLSMPPPAPAPTPLYPNSPPFSAPHRPAPDPPPPIPTGNRIKDAVARAKYDIAHPPVATVPGSKEPTSLGQMLKQAAFGGGPEPIQWNRDAAGNQIGTQNLGNGHVRTFHRAGADYRVPVQQREAETAARHVHGTKVAEAHFHLTRAESALASAQQTAALMPNAAPHVASAQALVDSHRKAADYLHQQHANRYGQDSADHFKAHGESTGLQSLATHPVANPAIPAPLPVPQPNPQPAPNPQPKPKPKPKPAPGQPKPKRGQNPHPPNTPEHAAWQRRSDAAKKAWQNRKNQQNPSGSTP